MVSKQLSSRATFSSLSACSQQILSCGIHQCPLKCHRSQSHSQIPCRQVCEERCVRDHPQKRKCSDPLPACKKCREYELQELRRAEQDEAHNNRLQEFADKINAEKIKLQEDIDERERAVALKAKEEELRQAQETSRNSRQDTKSFISSLFQTFVPPSSSAQTPPASGSTPNQNSTSSPPPSTAPSQPAPTPPPRPSTPPGNPATANQSGSEAEWQRQKQFEGANSPPIDAIMELIGLEEVKLQILRIKDKVEVSELQGTSTTDERFNVVLLGNPGTVRSN